MDLHDNAILSVLDFLRSSRKLLHRLLDPLLKEPEHADDQRNQKQQQHRKEHQRRPALFSNGIAIKLHDIHNRMISDIRRDINLIPVPDMDLSILNQVRRHCLFCLLGCSKEGIIAVNRKAFILPYCSQRFEDPVAVQIHEQHGIRLKAAVHDISDQVYMHAICHQHGPGIDGFCFFQNVLLRYLIKIISRRPQTLIASEINRIRILREIKTSHQIILVELVLLFQQHADIRIEVSAIPGFLPSLIDFP